MPAKAIDLTEATFGQLVVIGAHPERRGRKVQWICRCSCGGERVVGGSELRKNKVTRCHQCRQEQLKGNDFNRQHGMTNSPTYRSWQAMKERCTNSSHHAWHNYGGRGITVCQRWLNSFESFLADAGERPSLKHSLDRIDNDGNYEAGNIRWATREQQAENRRTNVWMDVDGVLMTQTAAAKAVGLRQNTVSARRMRGWSESDQLAQERMK